MPFINDKRKEEIIAKIIEHINNKLPKAQATLVAEFARQYYGAISSDELSERSVIDLYGSVLSLWELMYRRKSGECKIRIYNPHFEQHGWQSTHTIVEVSYDDMPFLVDSLRMEINNQGLSTHLMVHLGGLKLRRNDKHEITDVLPFNTPVNQENIITEAAISIEIDRQTDPQILESLTEALQRVLGDVCFAVEDWSKMLNRLQDALDEISKTPLPLDEDELDETKDFLRWLANDHFTFLGYREYVVVGEGDDKALRIVPNSSLGVLRDDSRSKVYRSFSALTPEARKQALSKHLLIISKTNTKSTVHRPAYTDYVGIKRFNSEGELIGEHRFIGLYTSAAYTSNPKYIPFVRRKVSMIMQNANLSPTGHAGKALINILETLPRDDLFQATSLELTDLAMGILQIQERKRIRLFTRMDVYHRFISCLVYIPRENFTTDLGYKMQKILAKAFNAIEISFTTWFSESVLARIHYVIHVDPKVKCEFDNAQIERKLIEIGRSWKDELKEHLLEYYGEERGNALYQKYRDAFPAGYREAFGARTAIYDIEHIEALHAGLSLNMSFYRPLEEMSGTLRFKLFQPNSTIPLSDAIPIFENMGLRVIGERPYEIRFEDDSCIWINDFSMLHSKSMGFDIEAIKRKFQEIFFHVWNGHAEDDGFNRLVLSAGLNWREITILRAYTKYLRQTDFTYSQNYIEETITKFPVLARLLVELFLLRFDPHKTGSAEEITQIEAKIQSGLDEITFLDEDKILRGVHDVINATLRTNYFQLDDSGENKSYLSFKLNPTLVPGLPLPLPMFEIFVYSPRFEGIHLRNAKVARGGLRWSDRREDFRTEVLGLMKAQVVKNSVIVPSGAKGGFVTKSLPLEEGSREAIMEEVTTCYKNFIRGLLDLTDNLNLDSNEVIHPKNLVSYDDEDFYLVVAADKGTATFSDIANEISREYDFWLDDAFASGGSTGYDHKKMGITARGAWESVKRHFISLGRDVQTQDFTVIGIGDMSGDVFGNGMLLSKCIKLVGAFNHMHIFLDPDPDPEQSFNERTRLFNMPRSNWSDYNRELISKGGGIYSRTSKAIRVSPEIKSLLNIKKDFVVPNELIRAMLTAPVDLLWNGGIGTYVKSSNESNSDVGDRANDNLRVNGNELNCQVVGEGGNLGFTQLGRVEYELVGGRMFTDFIDNSAGVDCSDHEVNIKILLNEVVANGDMTIKQRDSLLAKMANEVAELVLHNNYHQTLAINLASAQAAANIDLHSRYIQLLELQGKLVREIEFIPSDAELIERKAAGMGLTRPELAILFAYCKTDIKSEILDSDVPEDPYLSSTLEFEFPMPIRDEHATTMLNHRLRREIIATILSNVIVNEMGFTFVYQLHDETGAPVSSIVRAYAITRNIFHLDDFWKQLEALETGFSPDDQIEITTIVARLLRRTTRWFLRNRRTQLDITSTVEHFAPSIEILNDKLSELLMGEGKDIYQQTYEKFISIGLTETMAKFVAGERAMISALDIIEASNIYQFDLKAVARTYFALSEKLELSWFRDQINAHRVENQWDALAREACRDDLDWQQRSLTIAVIQGGKTCKNTDEKIELWMNRNKVLLERWSNVLSNLKSSATLNFTMFSVAVRELMDVAQHSFQASHISSGPTEVKKIAKSNKKKAVSDK